MAMRSIEEAREAALIVIEGRTSDLNLRFLSGRAGPTHPCYSEEGAYQNKLQDMALTQLRRYRDDQGTFRHGVDFQTNQPVYRRRKNINLSAKYIELMQGLFESFAEIMQEPNPYGV